MKAKVSRGSGAGGAARYILDEGELAVGDKGVEIVGGTCSGTTAEAVGREIGSMKNFRPDAKRHVWHCSLSLPPGEWMDSEKWRVVAEAHLKNMGLDPDSRFWIAVRHSDTDKDHIHILVNYNPTQSILDIVRLLKQISTYRIWRQSNNHIYLEKQFWNERTFWGDGYFACSTGNVSKEIIEEYIQNQG